MTNTLKFNRIGIVGAVIMYLYLSALALFSLDTLAENFAYGIMIVIFCFVFVKLSNNYFVNAAIFFLILYLITFSNRLVQKYLLATNSEKVTIHTNDFLVDSYYFKKALNYRLTYHYHFDGKEYKGVKDGLKQKPSVDSVVIIFSKRNPTYHFREFPLQENNATACEVDK